MDILKEQNFWHEQLAKIKQMWALGQEIDRAVRTCGCGKGYDLAWHLSNKEDFDALVRAFDADVTVEKDGCWTRYTTHVDSVRVFVLIDERRG